MKTETITIRITEDMRKQLDKAADTTKSPYAPTRTQLIERGIALALKELGKSK